MVGCFNFFPVRVVVVIVDGCGGKCGAVFPGMMS